MKKIILSLLLFIPVSLIFAQQETTVPDDVFENYLETHNSNGQEVSLGDSNSLGKGIANDNKVFTSRISSVIQLYIPNNSLSGLNGIISDLTGIEDFSSLVSLTVSQNSLTQLDISQNSNLQYLEFNDNQISDLDVSQNASLKFLYCSNNHISSIDVSNNQLLKRIRLTGNQLTSIDVSQNPDLELLGVSSNSISSIDITNNNQLIAIECANNNLTSLNISNNPNLAIIDSIQNQISDLDVSNNIYLVFLFIANNQIQSLDLTQQFQLSEVDISQNQLTYVNIKNGYNSDIEFFSAYNNDDLDCIIVDDAAYSTTYWTMIPSTTTFVESDTDCQALLVSDNELLNGLQVYPNPVNNNALQVKSAESAIFKIFDINGKIIINGKIQAGNNIINVTQLEKGAYLLKAYTNDNLFFKKIIIN
jgi:hypothetical protein